MNTKEIIIQKELQTLFKQATIGIEKEGQRVQTNGHIATSLHPKSFGSRQTHPYVQTDFAETQLELITPALSAEKDVMRFLSAIHDVTLRHLPKDEYIFPMSIPGIFPKEESILEAQASLEETQYREYLSKKYGKLKQMVSGIHYNFNFSKAFLMAFKSEEESLKDIQNKVYMKVARQFIRYQWVLIYLFGASPVASPCYFNQQIPPTQPVRSLRSSRFGYVNDEAIQVSYDSIESYATTLRHYVDTKQLIAEKELYTSVRFRGSQSVVDFIDKGIQYAEFRIFDLNPFAPYGILEDDIRFIHLFLMLMLWLEEEDPHTSVEVGKQYSEQVALSHPLDRVLYKQEGTWLFDELLEMARHCQCSPEDIVLIQAKKDQLLSPEKTIGGKLYTLMEKGYSITDIGMECATLYKQAAIEKPFGLNAFSNMELSTQALIEDAIRCGVAIDLLDENDQFLTLTYKKQTEYVKNGNMTRLDTYISPLIMENKVVTKKVLKKAGFSVPDSLQIKSVEEALANWQLVKGQPIVIKPKSTNYGLGISIFKHGTHHIEDFQKAIHIALNEDREVMIETFVKGTEYRFFVIDDQTKAVLLRVPANVKGDGKKTIRELVQEKNQSLLRGDGKTTPLKKIELGDIESLQLKEQGYTFDTVLPKGQTAWLRENSNISTGGDSIDVTDLVHDSYKELAKQITQTMMAKVCGVDLMIEDITQPATPNNYGVIETNFNPMMMMHIFPSDGKSRRLTMDVLRLLFNEKSWLDN